jgi:glucosamine--fructose-6-phosphate aminotransferase (isomerizing)
VVAILSGGSLLLWQARRSEAEAAQKTSFVANVSHEFKTPLTTIRLYAELLEQGRVRDAAQGSDYLRTIGRETQRLARLVNNALDFSRLEQGRKKFVRENVDLTAELTRLLDASPHVAPMAAKMKGARHLYYVGCGTSYHACVIGAVYAARIAGRPVVPVLAPQFIAQYGPTLGKEDVALFVSQSGETKDVLNALELTERRGATVLGLLNVIGSTLMHKSSRYLPLACGYEISVPATKTFLNQVAVFLYLALRMGGQPVDALRRLPDLLTETIDRSDGQLGALLPAFDGRTDFYQLGYGLTYGVALEGALKLKEITYAHCEGMLSTEFKHGPLSAIDDGYPVVFVVGPDDVPVLISAINEVAVRGGRAIAVAEPDARLEKNVADILTLPKAGALLNPILATVPLQLLSYRLSVARGLDPDFPRNLSKTLTVD